MKEFSIYHQPWRLVQNRIRGRGGREIDRLRGISPAVDDNSGSEAWIGSVTRVGNPPVDQPHYGCSEVLLPDGRRMFLLEAIALAPEEVLGRAHQEMNGEGLGVLVKYLDAQYKYGLQCHPTRTWAKQMWNNPYGKEESWYVIGVRDDTAEPAYVLLGFKEEVTQEIWERYYFQDDIQALENLCHKIPVQVGDAFFLGAGCPHALGEGCFVIEVQEPCDITLGAHTLDYYDQVHGKQHSLEEKNLHDERLLGAYLYDGCSYAENLKRWKVPRRILRQGEWGNEAIIIGTDQTRFFSFSELTVHGEATLLKTSFPQVAMVLAGEGNLECENSIMALRQGDELFFPYDIPGARVSGDLKLVLCNPEGVNL
jgi:mannose-6-phosphate isomerase